MLKNWQFNVLFFVGVGGAVLLLIGPEIGLEVSENPTAFTGVGLILAYVLRQKEAWTRSDDGKDQKDKEGKIRKEEDDDVG